jgi:putative ABC transport system ATP-binding protein
MPPVPHASQVKKSENTEQILIAREICKTFDRRDHIVLDHVSLSIARGETVAIMGPSGSGKTTLLSILMGLLPPDTGSLEYRFADTAPTDKLTARHRRNHIGIVFQSIHLIPTLSVMENVEIPLFGVLGNSAARLQRGREVLDLLGIAEMAAWRPNRLSGGERQRVAVARAFVNRPTLIFADEPTGNLDTASSERVISALIEMTANTGGSLIVVTHDAAIAKRLDRTLELVDGTITDSSPDIRTAI